MAEREEPAGNIRPAHCSSPRDGAPITSAPDLTDLDLAEEENDDARLSAEYLARREADVKLRDELALSGFTGPAWEVFSDALARYGLAVMTTWLATGKIFYQCKIKRCFPGPPPAWWTEDDRLEIADDTVSDAIRVFRDRALVAGQWDARGGASLKTYFIGQCVFSFSNAYRAWHRRESAARQPLHVERAGALEDRPDSGPQPDELISDRMAGVEALSEISNHRTREAVYLRALGHSNPEIAEIMRTTKGVVEGLFNRHKKRIDGAEGVGGAS